MLQPSISRKKIVIDTWLAEHPFSNYCGQPFLEPIRKLAERFGEIHPEYHINIRGCDYRTLPAEVSHAARQGNAPDIAEYYYTATQIALDSLAQNGKPLFTSVQKAVGGRSEILGEPVVLDDIVVAARDYYGYDGSNMSVPATATTTLLFTNVTLLHAAGVFKVPETWDEVDAACRAIAALPDGPSHCITWNNHGWLFQQAIAQQGGPLANHNNGRSRRATTIDIASKEMLAFVHWWRRLHQNGYYLYTGIEQDWAGSFKAFADQDVAFVLHSSLMTRAMVEAGKGAGFVVDVSRMPYNGRVPYSGNLISGQSLWLADGLEKRKQDGALAFIQYLINPRNAADWHKCTGFIPVTKASVSLLEEEGWFDANPQQRAATDQLGATDGSPAALGAHLGNFAAIQDVMTQAMEDVLVGSAGPVARFTLANARAQQLLDEYNAGALAVTPRTPEHLCVG